MANLGGTYQAGNETMSDRSALPPGEYLAQIVKSEWKDARKEGNRYINLEFEVVDGEAKGRRFWSMLNLVNANTTAVEMAQRELNSICHAIGKLSVNDTEELHHIPMLVKLKVEEKDGYEAQNRVVTYKPANGGAAPAPAGSAATPAQTASATRKPPWAA